MAEYRKPLPRPDVLTQPYWDGCKGHELRAQRCSQCGRFRWPPSPLCPHCRSWDFAWVPLTGTGFVYSFVVVHHTRMPEFVDDLPFVIARVALDGTDGAVRLTSTIIDCPWESVRVAMPVQVVWDDVTPDVTLPKFRPSATA